MIKEMTAEQKIKKIKKAIKEFVDTAVLEEKHVRVNKDIFKRISKRNELLMCIMKIIIDWRGK